MTVEPQRPDGPHDRSVGAEPHHIPHGYEHPKEPHHWWWYLGIVVATICVIATPIMYFQFDTSSAPLCAHEVIDQDLSPDETTEMILMRASCLGGEWQQRIVLRRVDKAMTQVHTVAVFDNRAKIRARWRSDRRIILSQTGGKIWSYEPMWQDIYLRYTKE